MAYADYTYYTETFRQGYLTGAVSAEAFPYLANLASLYIKSATKGVADKVEGDALEAVKMVTCAIAEVFQGEQTAASKKTDSGGGIVSSETVGSWSKSYVTGVNVSDMEFWNNRKRELLEMYLGALPDFAGLFRVTSYRCVHEARGCGR